MGANQFSKEPMTADEYTYYLLAEAVYGIPNPKYGGPRGQMITLVDTWYPAAEARIAYARKEGNRGVAEFDRDYGPA